MFNMYRLFDITLDCVDVINANSIEEIAMIILTSIVVDVAVQAIEDAMNKTATV